MKAKHDVKAPCDGKVASIDAEIGADIEARSLDPDARGVTWVL